MPKLTSVPAGHSAPNSVSLRNSGPAAHAQASPFKNDRLCIFCSFFPGYYLTRIRVPTSGPKRNALPPSAR